MTRRLQSKCPNIRPKSCVISWLFLCVLDFLFTNIVGLFFVRFGIHKCFHPMNNANPIKNQLTFCEIGFIFWRLLQSIIEECHSHFKLLLVIYCPKMRNIYAPRKVCFLGTLGKLLFLCRHTTLQINHYFSHEDFKILERTTQFRRKTH